MKAGTSNAGFLPVQGAARATTIRPPEGALAFTVNTRIFGVDADGQMQSMHPVDQAVQFALGFELGTIASTPDLGIRLDRLAKAPPSQLQGLGEVEVRDALSALLERGDVTLVSVVVLKVGWPVYIDVTYRNLRTDALMTARMHWGRAS